MSENQEEQKPIAETSTPETKTEAPEVDASATVVATPATQTPAGNVAGAVVVKKAETPVAPVAPASKQGGQGEAQAERVKNRGQNRIRSRQPRRETQGKKEIEKVVISLRRVTKVRAGSKRLRFSAAVVVGDKNGKVGFGLGRALDTRSAVEKATKKAQESMIRVSLKRGTIPHQITYTKGASRVVLRPAGPGTGVIAGASVRSVMEVAGVYNILTKILGTNDPIQNAMCAIEALGAIRTRSITSREFVAPNGDKKATVAIKPKTEETKTDTKK